MQPKTWSDIRELVSNAKVSLEEERRTNALESSLTDDGLAICKY